MITVQYTNPGIVITSNHSPEEALEVIITRYTRINKFGEAERYIQSIHVVEAHKAKKKVCKSEKTLRNHEIIDAVLARKVTIKTIAARYNISAPVARSIIHKYCKKLNAEIYEAGILKGESSPRLSYLRSIELFRNIGIKIPITKNW